MDWRSLIEDRERRELARRNARLMGGTMATTAPVQQPPEEEDDGGFFGKIGRGIGAVGGFFGDIINDVADKGSEAVGGITDVIQGSVTADNALEATNKRLEVSKQYMQQMNDILGDAADTSELSPEKRAQWEKLRDERKAALEKFDRETDYEGGQALARKEGEEAQAVDPLKTAAASAETFLNVAGVAGLAKAAGKGVLKQGAKVAGKEIFKQSADDIAEQAAKTAANRTAKGAARTIGRNAFEGGMFGAAYGGLQPLSAEGQDADPADVWRSALIGGTIGGVAGGGLTLLDKNVRAGARQIPGAVREGASDVAEKLGPEAVAARHPSVLGFDDQYEQLAQAYDNAASEPAKKRISQAMAQNRADRLQTMKAVTEGGYIGRGPAGPEDLDIDNMLSNNTNKRPAADAQKALEDAWNNNDLKTAQSIIDEMPDDMKVSMQGIQDYRVKDAGGVATPVDTAQNGADIARRQLDGEDIQPLTRVSQADEDIAQQVASEYGSVDQYIDERARQLLNEEAGKGVSLIPDGEQIGYGMKRVSDHAPWYSEMYRESGRKPSITAVRDRVRQALETGTDGKGMVYPEESRVYQLLSDRDAGMAQTIAQGPQDLGQSFMDDLGIPQSPSKTTSTRNSTKMPSGLPKGPQEGQEALIQKTDPYAGYVQDLERPALPAGEITPKTPKEAKKIFKKEGEIVDFINRQDPGKTTIELPASTDEISDIATRQTPGGKIKPLANNNAHITKDDVAAIRAIAMDDTGSAFTATRTPEMNIEEALRKRGGTASKEFKTLTKFNTTLREHTAQYARDVDEKRSFLEKFIKEFKIDGKKAADMRPYLEAGNKEMSDEALKQYAAVHGQQAAEGMVKLRAWWRTVKDEVRTATNEQIKKYAGEDRMMGDLGATYVPRVYKQGGVKGFKNQVFDVAHAGLDKLGGEKGMFNLANGDGYLSKETETFGGILRNSEGIPLNSEMAKPNTSYLSAAQKRTAKNPIGELEDPLTSMMKYFEATGRARYLTEDIARGRTFQKAIEMVNNETGNLRQMYKAFDDQVNAIAGKTSRFDRPLVDSKTGANVVNAATKIQSRISRSTIVGSASSAMAQTGQLPLIAAETGPKNFSKGMADMIRAIRSKADDPLEQSSLMRARYRDFEDAFKVTKSGRAGNKATDLIATPFRIIEKASSDLAWRSSYNKALEEGLTGKEAVKRADQIAAKIIGERTPGARAALYESKAAGPVTAYTLEVNQLYQVGKQYFKRDPKKAMQLVAAIWLYNQGYKAVMGNKLNADPLDATLDAANILTSDEYLDENGYPIGMGERLARAGGRIAGEAVDATPLGGPVVGQLYPEQGFRVPFGGGDRMMSRQDVFGDTNLGRYGGGTPIASGISNPLLLLGIPGMAQIQRSVEGNAAYNEGASTTPSGRTRFDIEQDPENYWRALLFGMYNTREGREYLAAQNARLAGQSQQSGLRY